MSGNSEGWILVLCSFSFLPFISPGPKLVEAATMGRSQGPNTGMAKARNLQILSGAWRQKPDRCLRISKVKDQDCGHEKMEGYCKCWVAMPEAGLPAGCIHPADGQQSSGLSTLLGQAGNYGLYWKGSYILKVWGWETGQWSRADKCYFSLCSGRVTISYSEASRRIKVKI